MRNRASLANNNRFLTAFPALSLLLVIMGFSVVAWRYGHFHGSVAGFSILFGTLLTVATVISWLVISGKPRRLKLKEPDLVLLQLIIIVIGLIVFDNWFDDVHPVYMLWGLLVLLLISTILEEKKVLLGGLLLLSYELFYTVKLSIDSGDLTMLTSQYLMFLGFTGITVAIVVLKVKTATKQARLSREKEDLLQSLSWYREKSMTDALTGLPNRRYLMHSLMQDIALAERGSYMFTVCYTDLDRFKQLNDSFGHLVGDEFLQNFAKIMKSTIRGGDYIARVGGDEFVLILVDANLTISQEIAERIRTGVLSLPVSNKSPSFRITTSIGITQYHEKERAEEIVARADQALYKAKQKGRNQTVVLN